MDIGIMAGRKKRESGQKVGGPVSRGRGRLGSCQFDETWHRPHPLAGRQGSLMAPESRRIFRETSGELENSIQFGVRGRAAF